MGKTLLDIVKSISGAQSGIGKTDKVPEGEARFRAKHVVLKFPDRAGNKDDVFDGTVVRKDTSKAGSYESPEDVIVYEDVNNQIKEARLVATHTSDDGKRVAKIYKDNEWGEHIVKFHRDGKYQKNADYHTDDKTDAHNTAKHFLKEDTDITQLDEISKKTLRSYARKAEPQVDDLNDVVDDPSALKRAKKTAQRLLKNRQTGLDRAYKRISNNVKEDTDVNQLDEISSKTLRNYAEKRSGQIGQEKLAKFKEVGHGRPAKTWDALHQYVKATDKIDREYKRAENWVKLARRKATAQDAKKRSTDLYKRHLAVKEDTDVTQLNEISTEKLQRYSLKALGQHDMATIMSAHAVHGSPEQKRLAKISAKRYGGIERAIKKLAKRAVKEDLTEAAGNRKVHVVVSGDKIHSAYNSLTAAKRKAISAEKRTGRVHNVYSGSRDEKNPAIVHVSHAHYSNDVSDWRTEKNKFVITGLREEVEINEDYRDQALSYLTKSQTVLDEISKLIDDLTETCRSDRRIGIYDTKYKYRQIEDLRDDLENMLDNACEQAKRLENSGLREETEPLNEISTEKLRRYAHKANLEHSLAKTIAAGTAADPRTNMDMGAAKTANKRYRGLTRAINKLAAKAVREETDLDETFRVGSIKLKDGSTVRLTEQQATLLNSLSEKMSRHNGDAMIAVAMKSKSDLNDILKFAKETV